VAGPSPPPRAWPRVGPKTRVWTGGASVAIDLSGRVRERTVMIPARPARREGESSARDRNARGALHPTIPSGPRRFGGVLPTPEPPPHRPGRCRHRLDECGPRPRRLLVAARPLPAGGRIRRGPRARPPLSVM